VSDIIDARVLYTGMGPFLLRKQSGRNQARSVIKKLNRTTSRQKTEILINLNQRLRELLLDEKIPNKAREMIYLKRTWIVLGRNISDIDVH
jgi:hypothetical protein